MNKYDYIILGGGIAGSLLAWQLHLRKKSFLLIDNEDPHASSRVAGGMINPITGKRLVLTWMAEKLYDFNHRFYPRLEKSLGVPFYRELPLRRVFKNAAQANDWLVRCRQADYRPFILNDGDETSLFGIKTPFGYGTVLGAAVDTVPLLNALHAVLGNSYRKTNITYDEIKPAKEHIRIGELACQKLIFCEGWKATANPWFSYLPFNPCKGDVLKIRAEISQHTGIAAGVFLLPFGDHFRCGSTYIWDELDCTATEQGLRTMTRQLENILSVPHALLEHKAAVRPTVKDRRPFLGRHPREKRFYIFNGLGTKGLSLAPWFSRHMADYLLGHGGLMPEVDIKRFPLPSI